jgi:hypothetical protein
MKQLIVLGMLLLCGSALWAETPQLCIPRLDKTPVLDGTLAPGEWERAAAVTGFIGATGAEGGRLCTPDATIYLAHDGTHIYLAVRTELLPGMVPSRSYRKRDEPVYMDSNQVEIWFTPPQDGGNDVTYQSIANAYGAIFDIRSVPALGAETPGWNGKWEIANSFERGKAWISELRIPFSSFDGAKPNPGKPWGGLVSVAWPQRSWPYTGGWYKNYKNHARYTFAETGNCAQLLSMNKLFENTLAPSLRLVNSGDAAGEFTVSFSVGDVTKTEKVLVPAHGAAPYTFTLPLPAAGKDKRTCVARVTDPAGTVLLAGEWVFVPEDLSQRPAPKVREPQKPFATRVQFGPESCGLKLWADLLDYPRVAEVAQVRFTVRPADGGAPLATHTVTKFAYDAAETLLWLPKTMAPGAYQVVTAFLAKDGTTLDEKVDTITQLDLAKAFYWYNNTLGETRKVAAPFTPVTVQGQTLKVWGREHRMDGALPGQVTSQGKAMLSGPVALVAVIDGKPVTAAVKDKCTVTKADPVRTTFRGSYTVPGVEFTLAGAIEMDGAIIYDLTTRVQKADALAKISRVYLSLPVKAECATTYYSTAGGWSGAFGEIPAKDGTVWSSDTTADFVPYVGLTDDERAIQWFADNDHNWALGKDAPCASVVRAGQTVEIQVNLVRTAQWDGTLAARFGLIATPVKPLPRGWRNTSLDNMPHYGSTTNLFYGEGHGGCTIDPHDTAKLGKAIGVDTAGKTPFQIDEMLAKLPPQPWSLERVNATGLNRDALMRLWGSDQSRKTGGVRHCYFHNAQMYMEGWRSPAFSTFFPAEWQHDPPSGWFHGTPTESYRDFFAFYADLWMKHWFMGGFYFDETYYPFDYSVFNGNGKVMADGSVRGSIPLLQQRAFMWRMWQLFHDNGREPFIWIHTSNFMAPHANGMADIAMYGEDRGPNDASDYIDNTPSVLLRSIGRGQKFGYIPVWMDQAGRGGFMQGSRQVWGWVWMHDAVPEYHTCSFTQPTLGLRVAWGLAEDDVRFLPFWNNPAVKTSDDQFIASTWTRPGKAMIMVLNQHKDPAKQTVTLTLDAAKLGLPDGFTVYNLESKAEVVTAKAAVQAWIDGRKGPEAGKLLQNAFKLTRDEKPFRQYTVGELQRVGGATTTLAVPNRDWVVLIAEVPPPVTITDTAKTVEITLNGPGLNGVWQLVGEKRSVKITRQDGDTFLLDIDMPGEVRYGVALQYTSKAVLPRGKKVWVGSIGGSTDARAIYITRE